MTNHQLEQLLKHGPFLQRLARKLLRDASRADDVVQEAWLVALRSEKTPDEVKRGWLAGIVRNLVRRTHRDEARRLRREKVAARTVAVQSTGDSFDEEMLRRRLAGLVLMLPEHYRTPILMRYYHNLEPLEIGERLGVSSSTVRTRLQRALGQIRTRLQAEHRGNGRALGWLLAAIVTGTTQRGAGAAAMLTRGTIAAALLTAVWITFAPDRWQPLHGSEERPVRHIAQHEAVVDPGRVNRTGTPESPDGAATRLLAGRVQLPRGIRTRTVRLEITALDQPGLVRAVANDTFQVGVDRLFRLGTPRALRVRATHPETEPLVVLVPVPWNEVTLTLQRRPLLPEEELVPARVAATDTPAAALHALDPAPTASKSSGDSDTTRVPDVVLRGVVRIPDEVLPDRVRIEVCRGRRCVRSWVLPEQEFALQVGALLTGELPATLRVTVSHPDTLPRRLALPVFAGPALEFVDVTLDPARTLRGVVEFEGEGIAEGATVAAFALENGVPRESFDAAATTDADGRFELPVAPDGGYYVVAVAPGWEPIGTFAADEMLLTLRLGVAIDGHVTAGAAGIEGASVRATLATEGTELVLAENALTWTPNGLAWRSVSARTDAQGAYRIGGLQRDLEYDVALGEEERQVVAPGTAHFVLAPTRLTITVRGEGAPVAGALVAAAGMQAVTDALGRAALEVASADAYMVAVAAEGYEPETRAVTGTVATFNLQPESQLATLTVSLFATGGAALPATCRFILFPTAPGPRIERIAGLENGAFVLRDLVPGAGTLVADCGAPFLPSNTPVTLRAGETTLLAVGLEAGGRIDVAAKGPDGEAVPAGLFVDGAHLAGNMNMVKADLLPPGQYSVWVDPKDPRYLPQLLGVTVVEGETTVLEVELSRWDTLSTQNEATAVRIMTGRR